MPTTTRTQSKRKEKEQPPQSNNTNNNDNINSNNNSSTDNNNNGDSNSNNEQQTFEETTVTSNTSPSHIFNSENEIKDCSAEIKENSNNDNSNSNIDTDNTNMNNNNSNPSTPSTRSPYRFRDRSKRKIDYCDSHAHLHDKPLWNEIHCQLLIEAVKLYGENFDTILTNEPYKTDLGFFTVHECATKYFHMMNPINNKTKTQTNQFNSNSNSNSNNNSPSFNPYNTNTTNQYNPYENINSNTNNNPNSVFNNVPSVDNNASVISVDNNNVESIQIEKKNDDNQYESMPSIIDIRQAIYDSPDIYSVLEGLTSLNNGQINNGNSNANNDQQIHQIHIPTTTYTPVTESNINVSTDAEAIIQHNTSKISTESLSIIPPKSTNKRKSKPKHTNENNQDNNNSTNTNNNDVSTVVQQNKKQRSYKPRKSSKKQAVNSTCNEFIDYMNAVPNNNNANNQSQINISNSSINSSFIYDRNNPSLDVPIQTTLNDIDTWRNTVFNPWMQQNALYINSINTSDNNFNTTGAIEACKHIINTQQNMFNQLFSVFQLELITVSNVATKSIAENNTLHLTIEFMEENMKQLITKVGGAAMLNNIDNNNNSNSNNMNHESHRYHSFKSGGGVLIHVPHKEFLYSNMNDNMDNVIGPINRSPQADLVDDLADSILDQSVQLQVTSQQ